MTLIMKFGGTSMGDAGRIRGCAELVRRHERQGPVVTVVSAMAGVTDLLLALADAAAAGNRPVAHQLLADLHARHEHAARELQASSAVLPLLDRLDTLVSGIGAVGELTPRSRDALAAFGERLSSVLMAAALDGRALTGQEAGIVTNEEFGEAEPLMNLSLYQVKETLAPLLSAGRPLVVAGFIAATQHGVTTTIGRGGSDYTATILGAALGASEIWIWSDVDGLMSADPRLAPDARLLDAITFPEAIEMGQFGAKTMHPRALEPAAAHGIPVRIRGTFNPDCPGTRIAADAPSGGAARCVLAVPRTALVTVSGAAMVGRPGTAARAFAALAEAGVNIMMISQNVSEAGISLVVTRAQLPKARAALEGRLLRTGWAQLIQADERVAVVALVGSGMRGAPGVFGAVAREHVNVVAIAQGSSELSICFVVHEDAAAQVVRSLHAEFNLARSA
jgi:aspartate kinase